VKAWIKVDHEQPPLHFGDRLVSEIGARWSFFHPEQWRICFRFADGDAFDVEITDYH